MGSLRCMPLLVLVVFGLSLCPTLHAGGARSRHGDLSLQDRDLLELAESLGERASDPESFAPRRAFLRGWLIALPLGLRQATLPSYAQVSNLRSLYAQDPGMACRRLDEYLRRSARWRRALGTGTKGFEGGETPISENPLPSAPRRVEVTRPSSVKAVAEPRAILRLAAEVKKKASDENSFQNRWQRLADFVKALPARVRTKELFGYAELVRCKIVWFGDRSGAAMALDEFVLQAEEWIRSRA